MTKKYLIYGLVDPKTKLIRYVGFTTVDLNRRLKQHLNKTHLNSGYSHKKHWLKSLLSENLKPEIIVIKETSEENWKEDEKHFIKYYNDNGNNLTNNSAGGYGRTGIKLTEEHRKLMSEVNKGRSPWNKGIACSEETKEKIINKLAGRKLTDEHRRNIGLAEKGRAHNSKWTKNAGMAKRKTTLDQDIYIRTTYLSGKNKMVDLAKEFGISKDTVIKIVYGRKNKYEQKENLERKFNKKKE